MIYRFRLPSDEIIDIFDMKFIPTKRTAYSIPPGMYEIFDINFMLKNLLPKKLKGDITNDDVRLKPNLKINQTVNITEMSFFIQF